MGFTLKKTGNLIVLYSTNFLKINLRVYKAQKRNLGNTNYKLASLTYLYWVTENQNPHYYLQFP